MKLSNVQLDAALSQLSPLLDEGGRFGYVVAVNFRKIRDAISEYLTIKYEIVRKYGDEVTDSEGNITDFKISADSDGFQDFVGEIAELADIEHDVDVLTIKAEDAIGHLTGNQFLQLDWMIED